MGDEMLKGLGSVAGSFIASYLLSITWDCEFKSPGEVSALHLLQRLSGSETGATLADIEHKRDEAPPVV